MLFYLVMNMIVTVMTASVVALIKILMIQSLLILAEISMEIL